MNKKRKKLVSILCLILVIIMLLSLVISVIPVRAYADEAYEQTLQTLEKARDAISAQVSDASSKLETLREQEGAVIDQKIALEQRNASALEELALIEKEVALYSKMIEQKAAEVEEAHQRELQQLSQYRTRVRAMEERSSYNILTIILNSDSFTELLAAIDDYGDIMDSDKKLADQYEQARMETERVKADYEAYKAQIEQAQSELAEKQKQLEEDIAESEEILAELTEAIEKAEEEKRKAEEAEQAASAGIAAFIADYRARQQRQQQQQAAEGGNGEEGSGSAEGGEQGGSGGGAVGTGSFMWPVPSSHRISSTYKMRWGKQHTGIDIDGFNLDGYPIVASDSGTVILASYYGGYGNCVMIDHGNSYVTVYGHMSGFAVSEGSYVSQGQTIGFLGNTGNSFGTHCHFEIRIDGATTDPIGWFSGYELEPGADE